MCEREVFFMKKAILKWASLLLALCVLAGGAGLFRAQARVISVFTDFSDSEADAWYTDYVTATVGNRFFVGVSATAFEPSRAIRRGEALAVLGRVHEKLTGQKIPEAAQAPFTDVKLGRFYTRYAAWAKENNLAFGITSNVFEPKKDVTQEELLALFDRYITFAGKKDLYAPVPGLDVTNVSDWAKESVENISGFDIIQSSHFRPKDGAKRGECAAYFQRLFEKLSFTTDTETPRLLYSYTTKTILEGRDSEEDTVSRPATPETSAEDVKYAQDFHALDGSLSGRGRYQVIEDEESLKALTDKLGRYGIQAEIAPSLSADTFKDHSIVAIEVKKTGKPNFKAELGQCKVTQVQEQAQEQTRETSSGVAVEGDNTAPAPTHDVSCTLNFSGLNASDSNSVVGYVFFLEVPKGVRSLYLETNAWTEDNLTRVVGL